ncbi:MAG TPA: efflux transporter outer membrane subunit, partial [Aquabacterium sp.]|nr:efflux transporter outer membrane subunit [Aquabacterium sp.]
MNPISLHPKRFAPFSLLPIALAVLLSACATHRGEPDVGLTIPQAWSQAASAPRAEAGTSVSPWWESLGDPRLNHLIEQAQLRNPNLALAALKVRRAQLVAGQAASDQLPTVSVKGSSTASRQLDGGATTRVQSVTAGVSWEADLWGRLASLKDAADWEAQATEEDRLAAALSLSATVANLYWQIAYLNQRVEASQQSIDYATRTLTLVEAQYRAGDVSGLELAQARQALAAQQASHAQWLQQRVQARNALAILFDAPPSQVQPEDTRLNEGALPAVEPGLPASLLTRRPDLRAAQLRLRRLLANVDATRASFYPTLTLTGSVGGTSTDLSKVLSDPVGTLGAGLVLPFVQWRDMQRNVAVSETDYEIAVVGYRQAWYQALSDVENALAGRQLYEEQGQQLQLAYQSAVQAEKLSEVRYRA